MTMERKKNHKMRCPGMRLNLKKLMIFEVYHMLKVNKKGQQGIS